MGETTTAPGGSFGRMRVVVALAVLASILFVFLGELNGLSGELTTRELRPASIQDLTSPGVTVDNAEGIVGRWAAFEETLDDRLRGVPDEIRITTGRDLAEVYLLTDVVFAVVYGSALLSLWVWMRRNPPEDRGRTREATARFHALATSRWVSVFVVLAVVADLVENALALSVITSIEDAGRVGTPAIWALKGASGAKWFFLGLVAVPLAGKAVTWAYRSRRDLWGQRVPIVVVAVFLLLLNTDQAIDVVRGWDLWLAMVSAVTVLALAGLVVAVGRDFIRPRADIDLGAAPDPWAMAAAGLLFLVVGGVLVSGWSPARGFGIPLLISAAILFLSAVMTGAKSEVAASAAADQPTAEAKAAVDAVSELSDVTIEGADGDATKDAETEAALGVQAALDATVQVQGSGPLVAVGVAAAAPIVLAATVVRALAGDVFYQYLPGPGEAFAQGGGVMLAATFAAVSVAVLAVYLGASMGPTPRRLPGWAWAISALAIGLGAALFLRGAELADAVGTIGIAAVFLTVCTAGLGLLNRASEWLARSPLKAWSVPPLWRAFGYRRPPLVLGLVLWLLLASVLRGPTRANEARVLEVDDDEPAALQLDELLAARVVPLLEESDGEAVPLVFVSASGGGVRAAYWTAAVVTCLLERAPDGDDPCGAMADADAVATRHDRVLVMSGISGGSVGLASYVAHSATPSVGSPAEPWYGTVMEDDTLAPAIARWFFADIPNLFSRITSLGDRAAALEEAWEAGWSDHVEGDSPLEAPLLRTQGDASDLPLLLLNSFSVEDGCRLNVSALVSNGPRGPNRCQAFLSSLESEGDNPPLLDGTTDLTDLLCNDQDLRLSTAAFLSARFPFVTPSGQLESCNGEARTFGVDGGYRDTSAASPIVELWPAIEERIATLAPDARITPIFVQIDNGYDAPAPPSAESPPSEVAVPIQGLLQSGGISDAAKQSAERTFGPCLLSSSAASSAGGYVRITTYAHPGSEAPLGWYLSARSRDDLDGQLAVNGEEIQVVRNLIDGVQPAVACRASEATPTS